MNVDKYLELKQRVISAGFERDITWAEGVSMPGTPVDLAAETIWVVCNSGMKFEIAQSIFKRVCDQLLLGPVKDVFKNKNKARAIQAAWDEREARHKKLQQMSISPTACIEWFASLDGIGPITKYHLARNVGIDVCKPDRHLVRIAGKYDMTPHKMCQALAEATGDRIGTVDVVIWRAAVMGIV